MADCYYCEKGFPLYGGIHRGTQSLGMIPATRCEKLLSQALTTERLAMLESKALFHTRLGREVSVEPADLLLLIDAARRLSSESEIALRTLDMLENEFLLEHRTFSVKESLKRALVTLRARYRT